MHDNDHAPTGPLTSALTDLVADFERHKDKPRHCFTEKPIDYDSTLAYWLNAWEGKPGSILNILGDRELHRLFGTDEDQVTPHGILNPYWELVRHLPMEPSLWGRGRSEIACAYSQAGQIKPGNREQFVETYSWSIPSPRDIAWIKDKLNGQDVVEIGAGAGYWAWQLSQAGVDVVAYDVNPVEDGDNGWTVAQSSYHTVLRDDASAAKAHPHRALMICWPRYSHPMAAHGLASYAGDTVIYIGESDGGCTADGSFFELLEAEWEHDGCSPGHISFFGIHCYVNIYRRRKEDDQS